MASNETKDSLPQQQRGGGQSRNKIETTIIISEIRNENVQNQAKSTENSSTTNKQSTKTSTSITQSSSGVMTGA